MQGLKKQSLSFLALHRRKLILLSATITLYGLAGFFLLPWLAEKQLVDLSKDRLSLRTTVESVYFNPFSFYFEINGLELKEFDGADLFSLGHAHMNLQPSQLALLKVQILDAAISEVELYLERKSDSEDTVSMLAQRWYDSGETTISEELAQESASDTGPFPLELLNFSISDIDIHLMDSSIATVFDTTVGIKHIQTDNLSTLADSRGRQQITIDFEQQSQLTVAGEFGLNPLQFQGNVALEEFPVNIISRYAQDSLPALVESGRLSLSLNYYASLAGAEPEIAINQFRAALNGLAITEKNTDAAFFQLGSISLADGEARMPDNTAQLGLVTLDGLKMAVAMDADRQLNVVRMIENLTPTSASLEPPQEDESPEPDSNTEPWKFDLNRFQITNSTVSMEDSSLEQSFYFETSVNGSADDLGNEPNRRFPVSFDFDLASGGSVSVEGDIQALPELDALSRLSVSEVDLTVVQPYVNTLAFAKLQQGALNLNADIAINNAEPFSAEGSLSLNNVSTRDSRLDETLVAFEELAIDALRFSTTDNTLEISEVTLNSLFARVIINEDGSNNIGRSIKTNDPTTADPEPSESRNDDTPKDTSSPLAITVGQVRIDNGSANFTDKDLPIVFNANIQNLSGSAEGFATNTVQTTSIQLEGEVDDYGLVQISSSIKPFAVTDQSQIRVNFTNIDMPAMTPYVIKFAGREITDGSIDLALIYDINGGGLKANNQLVLSDLKLGERIEHPDAMDLPLDLALALLKDSNGVIDLEVPINGDVNDPEFDFGPAIRRALRNVITNVVAAPFRLLGGLVGSGDNSLDSIRFLPGRSDIAAPERQVLLQLGEALQLRPQLALAVPAVTASEDRLALQNAALVQKIDDALALTENSDQLLTTRRREILERFHTESMPSVSLEKIQQRHTSTPTENDSSSTTDSLFDVIAYNAELQQRLVEQESLAPDAMTNLASARFNSVSNFLQDNSSVLAARILQAESSDSELDETGWLSMKFELTSAD